MEVKWSRLRDLREDHDKTQQELADYLGVDRSALCAELSRMKKEGLLDYHRHDFCLKDTLLEDTFEI